MKVLLYRNTNLGDDFSLAKVLENCMKLKLADREQPLGGKAVVLEDVIKESNELYKMEFTLRREDSGPGRSRRGKATEDFELKANEGFGEQAAALYSPRSDLVAVQYNHFGPRAHAMVGCLWHICKIDRKENTGFHWDPVLDDATMAKLTKGLVQKKLEVSFSGVGISDISHKAGNSLSSILVLQKQVNAGNLSLTLSLGRGRSGESLNLKRLVSDILKTGNVVKLQARVGQEGSGDEVLDFLGGRVESVVDVDGLKKTDGRRYTFDSRTQLMKEELEKWVNQGYGK